MEGDDFYDYSDEIAILVESRGFEKGTIFCFEIVSSYVEVSRLTGRLLYFRNIENKYVCFCPSTIKVE